MGDGCHVPDFRVGTWRCLSIKFQGGTARSTITVTPGAKARRRSSGLSLERQWVRQGGLALLPGGRSAANVKLKGKRTLDQLTAGAR